MEKEKAETEITTKKVKAKTEIATKNLSGRLSSIAGLSSGISDYDGKKAAGDDLTAERRANRLVRL